MILIQSILIINIQIFLKMNNQKKGRVIKILDGTIFHIQDSQTMKTSIVELCPQPSKPNYYHLLQKLSDMQITYEMAKKTSKIKQQIPKCSIYLQGKSLSELYDADKQILECTDDKIYEKDQIIECYIMGIQCLKMKLYLLQENKYLTFYFSELKLPKIQQSHPKEVWVKAEEYFRSQFLGDFVQVKINGSESYREQRNIYGEILRLHNGVDIKQKCLQDGYAQLSKNSQKYLSHHDIQKLSQKIQQSRSQKRGIWGTGQQKITKGANQLTQQKYNQWQQWTKKKQKYPQIKNIDTELKQLCSQLKKNNNSKSDPNKCRIILQTVMNIFEQCTTQKNIAQLQQFIKIVISAIINIQTFINCNTDNYDFLKYLNKLFILVLFFVLECEKLGNKNRNNSTELEKIIKVAFKCCFIGNQTFHEKVFDRRKESDFGTFEFDQASLSGISSYSEASDIEDNKQSKYSKTQKKIASAQAKIRINATLLIGALFKNYPSIVENHWQICVKSNALAKQFMDYLQKLKIAVQPTKMTLQQKNNIVSLMRTNFGDYSLVLLIFFEQNAKVKMNALNCLIHMIGNFQSRKIIDTTEAVYVEKLLNQTKSSFVPKSFIVFSGLRNALYFMLFSLYHERNILIIMNTFKALTQLCQQSTLIDKMGFIEGMGLLMSNYICPVLKFPWEGKQLIQLKCLCVQFLGALVNTQKKWDEMENLYLMSEGQKNINCYLVSVLIEDKERQQHQKIVVQISKYFKNMTKRYLPAIFYQFLPGISIWSSMANYYLKNPHSIYPSFVEQVFKCHFDQLSLIKSHPTQSRRIHQTINKAQSLFGPFLSEFFSIYSKIITNENYIGLLNIITYVPYHKWSENQFKPAKQFLGHCFKSINEQNVVHKIYPSFQPLKSNSLVRLGLIKLLGYISFCKQFQNPEYSTLAIKSLLQYSQTYKSPNSVVKITWGISNWSNIDCFKQGLTQKQLKECLDYMIKLSQSDKQKIASNCTRGIGFFLTKFNKDVNIQQCRLAIIKNLSHPILKVRINSTKTLRMMINIGLVFKEQNSQKTQQLISILQQNILKNNYHLQTQTLLLIKDLGNPIKQKHMMKIYSHILHDLLSHTTMEYEFSEIKALKQLRKVVLQEMVKYPEFLLQGSQTAKQFYQTVQNFIIDSQEQSIRKEAENSKILERGFQKGEEALNAVFNIVKQKYDQEKTITTSFTTRGIQYEAQQADLQLLGKIKNISKQLEEKDVEAQKLKWKFLADMKIEDRKVFLGKY